jgi:hypothetical protein
LARSRINAWQTKAIAPKLIMQEAFTNCCGGCIHPATNGSEGNNAFSANVIKYFPWYLPEPMTITELHLFLVTGAASGKCRFGLYTVDWSNNKLPGSLIQDSGEQTATTGQNNSNLTVSGLSLALDTGWYWGAYIANVGLTIRSLPKEATLGYGKTTFNWWDLLTVSSSYAALASTANLTSIALEENMKPHMRWRGTPR